MAVKMKQGIDKILSETLDCRLIELFN